MLNRIRAGMRTALQTARAYWVVLIAPLLLFAPLVLQGKVIFWGTSSLQFIPWWVQAWESLRQGVLPLWNPLNGMGAPLLANYQAGFLYPLNWPLFALAAAWGPAGVAVGYTLLAVLHLAWAGLGMSLLLRRLGINHLGQIIGGLAYGLAGYLTARVQFLCMVWVAAWLPWVILFADSIASLRLDNSDIRPFQLRKRIVFVPGLTAALAIQLLAGHAQLAWYSILLAGAWITAGALRESAACGKNDVRQGVRNVFQQAAAYLKAMLTAVTGAWLSFAAAGVLAACIAAAQIIPTFEYLRVSPRADAVGYEEAMLYSFWPWRFVSIFAPDFFGNPASGDFWGYASYWEDHLYAGLLPLILALSTLFLVFRKSKDGKRSYVPLLVFLWLVIAAGFLLGLGKFTPIFPFLYENVPAFDMFKSPTRYLLWAAFAIPVLAAAASDRWRQPEGRGLYWFRLMTAGTVAVSIGAGLALVMVPDLRLTFSRALALAGMWALGFCALTLLKKPAEKNERIGLWKQVVILWTLVDLLVTGWALNPGVDLSFYTRPSRSAAEVAQMGNGHERVYISTREQDDLKFERFMRFNDYQPLEDWHGIRDVLIPNSNLLDGIRLFNNFDPLVPDSFQRWTNALDAMPPGVREGWLALLNVGIVEQVDVSSPLGVRFMTIDGFRRWQWYTCIETASSLDEAWAKLGSELNHPPQPDRRLIVEVVDQRSVDQRSADQRSVDQRSAQDCPPVNGGQSEPTVQFQSERPDRVSIKINAPEDGWLSIADTWYPEWQALVDGVETPLYRADGHLRALAVPAGEHEILIQYRSFGFYFGALFSILGILLYIYLLKKRGSQF